MHRRLPLLFRAIAYGLRGGFLIRPFVIALALGAVGAVLSSAEEQIPALGAWVPATLFPSRQDPQVAQVILSAIATSIMTVVSIVFAMLLMTLTLASTQFSPRILINFGEMPYTFALLQGETLELISREGPGVRDNQLDLPPMTLAVLMSASEEVQNRQVTPHRR